jgi:hypothetical protein
LGWLAAAAVIAVAVGITALRRSGPAATGARQSAISNPQSAAAASASMDTRTRSEGPPDEPRLRGVARRRGTRAAVAGVIVPEGEARRLEAYSASVSRAPAAAAPVMAEELVIAAIEIEPLPDGGETR